MKKLNLTILALITLFNFSCSSDDDTNNNNDIIVGSWEPVRYVEVYSESGEEVFLSSSCEQQSVISFNSNGEFTILSYYLDIDDNCIEDEDFVSASWERLSEGQYEFTETYYNSDTDEVETDIYVPDAITFPNTDVMRIRFDEEIDGSGDVLEYSFTEFERID